MSWLWGSTSIAMCTLTTLVAGAAAHLVGHGGGANLASNGALAKVA